MQMGNWKASVDNLTNESSLTKDLLMFVDGDKSNVVELNKSILLHVSNLLYEYGKVQLVYT